MSNIFPEGATIGTTGLYPSATIVSAIPIGVRNGSNPYSFGFYDRFTEGFAASSAGVTLNGWIASEVTDGNIVPASIEGGGATFNTAATENNGIQVQKPPSMLVRGNWRTAFETSVSLVDADQCDLAVGLATADTDVAQTRPDDFIGFYIADGAADIYCVANDGTTATGVDTGSDASDGTYVKLGFVIDESGGEVRFYVNGNEAKSTTSNLPGSTTELGATLAIVTGEAANNAATFPYCFCYTFQAG
jgi:hypothetical protein